MTTQRQRQRIIALQSKDTSPNAEWTLSWLVLLSITASILSAGAGHSEADGKSQNGVRRAASQLERKFDKGLVPPCRDVTMRIG